MSTKGGQAERELKSLVRFCAGLAIALIVLLVGCSGYADRGNVRTNMDRKTAPGRITLDVLEAGHPEHYWQYELAPAEGAVRMVTQRTFSDYMHEDIPEQFQEPAGAIQACVEHPKATSPDGKYVASCTGQDCEFSVNNRKSGAVVSSWKSARRVRGFAWAPSSESVAVLTTVSRLGIRPSELLALASGHPVSHDTVYLDIVDVTHGTRTEFLVRPDVISAFTRILAWSE